MERKLPGMTGAGLACISLLLAGCGEIKVKQFWPFGNESAQERPRTPANAADYQCAGGKRFYVRTLEGGAAVWLILADREVRLAKLGTGPDLRYSNGIAVLEINGNDASLKDGAAASFTGCKAAGSDAK